MSKTTGESMGACERLRPSAQDLEMWQEDGTIKLAPAGKRLLRALVADDCRDNADSLSILVEMWGHEVRVAYDGAAALELAFAYQPDVLLLDIAMPRMD